VIRSRLTMMAVRAAQDAFAQLDADMDAVERVSKRQLVEDLKQLLIDVETETDPEGVASVRKCLQLAEGCVSGLPSVEEARAMARGLEWPPPVFVEPQLPSPGRITRSQGREFFSIGFLAVALGKSVKTLRRWEAKGWLPRPRYYWRGRPPATRRAYTEEELFLYARLGQQFRLCDPRVMRRYGRVMPRFCATTRRELAALK
jgi:hypothetical protein